MAIPAKISKKLGQAMHDYSMFADQDNVLVAVSGGVDSMVLAVVLAVWRRKAPIDFQLVPSHIDHGFWRREGEGVPPNRSIGEQLQPFGLELTVVPEWDIDGEERSCYTCARNRRSQLFDLARHQRCGLLAFGHHRDDLIETLFLNVLYAGNISTMRPVQHLFEGRLKIVRPLAYLEKDDITTLARLWRLAPVKNLCPLSDDTRREWVRGLLQRIYQEEPAARQSIFAALKNVRREYLL